MESTGYIYIYIKSFQSLLVGHNFFDYKLMGVKLDPDIQFSPELNCL